jgi:isopentenyldiphosphate isomerase
MTDEYLDLVNEKDEVVGKKLRSEVYAEGLSNFRVVNVFLRNFEGKLWIPRRTANKRIFPLCLDVSMGGHVESGESYEVAFKRELSEESHFYNDRSCFLDKYKFFTILLFQELRKVKAWLFDNNM